MLINLELLPNMIFLKTYKCKVYVESKFTKHSFQTIQINSEPLDLIHLDISDLKMVQTRGEKKYYITFIDYCTRYDYIYLLRSKDEALKIFKYYKNKVENQLHKK